MWDYLPLEAFKHAPYPIKARKSFKKISRRKYKKYLTTENNKAAAQWRQDIQQKKALEILNIISNF